MLDRRSLVQAPGAPRDQSQHPRARNDYELELIQTRMAQKPMLRVEVYAHAMGAGHNREKKKGSA